jgi:methionyl-tRNA formyltransferase
VSTQSSVAPSGAPAASIATLRIVVVGAIDFTQYCVEAMVRIGTNIVGIVTVAAEQAVQHADYVNLVPVGRSHNIPVQQVADINAPCAVAALRALRPDVIFVLGWSRLIAPEVLRIPRLGCIGSHPTLLPANRGRHPLIWALVDGLERSGLTLMYLTTEADAGDIVWQQAFPITMQDDASSLYAMIKRLVSLAIKEVLSQLAAGTLVGRPQDHTRATYWRKRTEADGEIHWADTSQRIYNLVRALTHPYVGAHAFHGKARVTIWKSALPHDELPMAARQCLVGSVFRVDDHTADVRTGDGYIRLLVYTCSDAGMLTVGDRLRGSR